MGREDLTGQQRADVVHDFLDVAQPGFMFFVQGSEVAAAERAGCLTLAHETGTAVAEVQLDRHQRARRRDRSGRLLARRQRRAIQGLLDEFESSGCE